MILALGFALGGGIESLRACRCRLWSPSGLRFTIEVLVARLVTCDFDTVFHLLPFYLALGGRTNSDRALLLDCL